MTARCDWCTRPPCDYPTCPVEPCGLLLTVVCRALPYSGADVNDAQAVIDALADAGFEIVAAGGDT